MNVPAVILAVADTVAIDFNLIVNTVILGVSAWTLKSVSALQNAVAISNVRESEFDKDLAEIRSRLAHVEVRLQQLELQVAGCQARKCDAAVEG
jgi:hypothetical protein